jgi:integrase
MPVYRKSRDRWRVVIFLNGKRTDLIVKGSKEDAEAAEARERVRMAASDPLNEQRVALTFADFCATEYRPHAELHLKASTWERRASQLAFLMEAFGETKLTHIHARAVDAYARKREEDGLRKVSINNELRVLRVLLNFARERKFLVSDVKVKLLKVPYDGRAKAWTMEEIGLLLGALQAEATELLPIVVFILNTGARKGEALAQLWKRVNFEKGLIEIWPSEEWQPKSGLPREIPISDGLKALLKKLPRRGKWVFPSETGERWAFWPRRQFDRAREKAGLTGGPHKLRHTFASHFLVKVPDLGILAAILGHTEESVTRLYGHMLPERLAKARNVVSIAMPKGPTKAKGPRNRKRQG